MNVFIRILNFINPQAYSSCSSAVEVSGSLPFKRSSYSLAEGISSLVVELVVDVFEFVVVDSSCVVLCIGQLGGR